MRVVYIADDGTQFDSEIDCELYEESIAYDKIYDIEIFDAGGDRIEIDIEDGFGEFAYNNSYCVVIHDEKELAEFQRLAEYAGWCDWNRIDSPGIWKWTYTGYTTLDGKFVKEGDA